MTEWFTKLVRLNPLIDEMIQIFILEVIRVF